MKRIEVPGLHVTDYVLRTGSGRTFLMLHGYQQTGEGMFQRLESSLPSGATILAPNAPYPIPDRRPDGYKVGFSWYFYNPQTDEYFIDMKVSVIFLNSLLKALGLDKDPVTVIGFSQGGYLAPFLAAENALVDHVIGIASSYLPEEFSKPLHPKCRLDAILGENDEIVLPAEAQKNYQGLQRFGLPGVCTTLPGVGHRMTSEVQTEVARLVAL